MSHDAIKSLENALAQVRQDRRGFLKTLLIGSTVAAIPLMTSEAIAGEEPAPDDGKAKKKKKKKGDDEGK